MWEQFKGTRTGIKVTTELDLLLHDLKSNEKTKVVLDGKMEIEIGEAFVDAEGLQVLPWRIVSMGKAGNSSVGKIGAQNSQELPTFGVIRQRNAASPFPADLRAFVYIDMDVPKYGALSNSISPMVIEAEVKSLPPFGVKAVAKTVGLLARKGEGSSLKVVGQISA